MGIKIEDGAGGGKTSKVNNKNRLDVSSANFSEAHLIAAIDAQCYSYTSSFSAATGNEILYIKNTSKSKKLILSEIYVGGVNTGLFEIFEVTGTAAGTAITAKNTNLASSNAADSVEFGDASVTGLTIGDRMALLRTPANTSAKLDTQDAIILGLNEAIAITYTGSTGTVDAFVLAYFESEDDI